MPNPESASGRAGWRRLVGKDYPESISSIPTDFVLAHTFIDPHVAIVNGTSMH